MVEAADAEVENWEATAVTVAVAAEELEARAAVARARVAKAEVVWAAVRVAVDSEAEARVAEMVAED